MAPFVFDPASSRTERQQQASRAQGQGAESVRTPPGEVRRRPTLLCYGVAVAAVIMVLILRLLREAETPLLLWVAAVATSAWYGGLGPGLLAAGLATLLSHDVTLTLQSTFASGSPGQDIWLALFALDALMITRKIPTTATLWTQDSAPARRPLPGHAGHRRSFACDRWERSGEP